MRISLGRVLALILCFLPSALAQRKPETTPVSTAVPRQQAQTGGIRFRDVAAQVGVTTQPKTELDRRYIVEEMTAGGVALFDCDNDGKLDIAVANDSSVQQYLNGGTPMITLYHQDTDASGHLHFTDITNSAGLTVKGWATAIAVADYDNDGLPDLYVSGFGHNVLYHNLGGCKFEDVTKKAGLEVGGFSTGAAWADYDRDGNLDLFVARYVHTDPAHLAPSFLTNYKGVQVEVPDAMPGETDFLFHNRGDGTFEDVSAKARVNDPQRQHGMGVTWGDFDGDGWPDLYVTNDSGWCYLYHNKHDGTFAEIGLESGAGVGPNGEMFGNMAADFADFDRDGKLDLFVTRYGDQAASLYWNQGNNQFTDVAVQAGLSGPTFRPVKWGTGFGDFDNDGWPDILMANGNFTPLMDAIPSGVPYLEPIQLFRNLGNRTFEDIADPAGLNAGSLQSRRGTAFGDLNDDGNLDVVVFNVNAPPSVFLNETHNGNHRALFRLVGHKSNREAVGARMLVTTSAMTQIDEVHAGNSYNSTSDPRLHFGLGKETVMKKVEVRWPSGQTQDFNDVAADAIYQIDEGEGIKKIVNLPQP